MGERRYFGTDGIRGRVGEPPITPDFVLKLGWAVGRVLGRDGGKVLIGKDTRISGYMFDCPRRAWTRPCLAPCPRRPSPI